MESTAGRSPAPLGIHLFGRIEVQRCGEPLPPLRSRKETWLLALLALRHQREVDRAWLATLLWPESCPERALFYLRRSLGELRRALGPQAARLRSPSPRTLLLNLNGAEVDFLAFDRAIARGDRASLEAAVALYRGPLLEGCGEEWVVPEREMREQAFLKALEALAGEALAREDFAAAERYLRRAVALDPLRETAQRALMQVLAAGGNAGAALRAYQDLRSSLQRQVDAEPDPQTETLKRQIQAEAAPRPKALRESDLLPSASSLRHLPQPLTPLVGREPAVREVRDCLDRTRLVTLTGAGGIGKTRLAIQVAEEIAPEFPDGVWFIDLASLTDATLVPQTVARGIGIPEVPGVPPTVPLQEALRNRQLLLVLDNCEHLVDACAHLANALLTSCPRLRLLATSRQALGLTGETAWRVPSLSLPPAAPPWDNLSQIASVRLFLERGGEANPAFQLAERHVPAVVQICRRLDGVPLAIELAAARLKLLSPAQIAARLEDCFAFLIGGSRAALPRQQTLRATVDWSYALLTAPEQALLRRLAVFRGGWTLEAAEAVCGADLDLLGQLVDKSLVLAEDGGGTVAVPSGMGGSLPVSGRVAQATGYPPERSEGRVWRALDGEGFPPSSADPGSGGEVRYRLLEPIRQYAEETLKQSEEAALYRSRHRDYYLELAERVDTGLQDARRGEGLEQLEIEHDNLRAALAWSLEAATTTSGRPHREASLRLAGAMARLWEVRGYWKEGRERLAAVLRVDTDEGADALVPHRARVLHAAGQLARLQRDYETAQEFCARSLALRRAIGDLRGCAESLGSLGKLAEHQENPSAAQVAYEECLSIRRRIGDPAGTAIALNDLGDLARDREEFGHARTLLEESLAIRRTLGDEFGIAASLCSLGQLSYHAGEYAAARAWFEEGFAIQRRLRNKVGIAYSLHNLGEVARCQGDFEFADTAYRESLALFQELGDRWSIAGMLCNLGHVARSRGDFAEATAFLAEAFTRYRALGSWRGIALCLEALAAVAVARGDAERAARLLGGINALHAAIWYDRWPADRMDYEWTKDATRAALGEDAYAALAAEGATMSLEAAFACALETEATSTSRIKTRSSDALLQRP